MRSPFPAFARDNASRQRLRLRPRLFHQKFNSIMEWETPKLEARRRWKERVEKRIRERYSGVFEKSKNRSDRPLWAHPDVAHWHRSPRNQPEKIRWPPAWYGYRPLPECGSVSCWTSATTFTSAIEILLKSLDWDKTHNMGVRHIEVELDRFAPGGNGQRWAKGKGWCLEWSALLKIEWGIEDDNQAKVSQSPGHFLQSRDPWRIK